MSNRDELRERIAADFAQIHAELTSIAPPARHAWRDQGAELTWFANDILASTRHGASIFLRRDPIDDYDPHQIHVEVRIHWSENSGPQPGGGAIRATIWVEHGTRINFTSKSLLRSSSGFVYADDPKALIQDVRCVLTEALEAYRVSSPHRVVRVNS